MNSSSERWSEARGTLQFHGIRFLTAVKVIALAGILGLSGPSHAADILYSPTDDASVDSKRPSDSTGSDPLLEVRGHPRNTIHSYLKFNVSGSDVSLGPVRLRLYVAQGGTDGDNVHLVSNNFEGSADPWTEDQLTWENAPLITSAPIDSAGVVGTDAWVEWDVSSVVTGDGVYSFAIANNSNSRLLFNSSEASANQPELVIVDETNTAPTVTIGAPATGSSFVAGDTVTFSGTGSDIEDGDVSANLSWTSSLDGAIGSGAAFGISSLSVGTHTITASVTDSGGLSSSDEITITVDSANTAPTVTISSPANGTSSVFGDTVTFSGTGSDTEDGDVSANLSWTSSLDGAIGSGGSFGISTLSVGTHTITASVTDSGALSGSDAITITVDEANTNTAPTVTINSPANGSSSVDGDLVSFSGTGSDTEDGDVSANLTWSSSLDGAIGSGASFGISSLTVGTHTITASVTDSGGLSGSDSITITVDAANTAPTVTINTPANGSSSVDGDLVSFSGTGSDTEDGDVSANLSWSSSLDGAIGSGASFGISNLSVGTHTITASVTDSGGLSGSDSITITVDAANGAPTVTITSPANGSSSVDGDLVTFSGTGNDTDDGDLSANLSWSSSLDGAIGSGASFGISNLSVGTHTITASVTDSGGLSGSDSITITVDAANTAPTVTINSPANGSSSVDGDLVSFSGTGSDTEDGDVSANLSWSSSLDGAIGSGASFGISSLTVGTHTITASVTDTGGLSGSDSITITVDAANTAPTVTINSPANGSSSVDGDLVSFSGTGSDTEDGDVSANLSWSSSLDGAIGSGASFGISSLTVGTHTITASVTDTGGLSGSDSITITVDAANTAPTVTITSPANGSSFVDGDLVTFVGSASDLEDTTLSSLLWDSSLDGPIGSGDTFSMSTLSVGTHTITASVTDSGGLSGSDALTITVDAANTAPTVTITSPANGSSFVYEDTVTFTGSASDLEDATLSSLLWDSSLDGPIGSGDTFSMSTLSVGTHTITASVTDSGGLSGSDQINISVAAASSIFEVQVSTGSDDAEETATGGMDLSSSDLEFVFDDSNQVVGIRFNNVTIEQGARIDKAYIQFTVDETNSDATTVYIDGEAVDNAATFTNSSFNISGRQRTSTGVWWSPPPWTNVGDAGPDQRTEDLSVVINEIIDRPGWVSGNSIVLIFSGSGERTAEAYNGTRSSAPVLHIEYSEGDGNRQPTVDAGSDAVLTLPEDTLNLDGTVTDDGLPDGGTLITTWSHVGGTGTGAVNFGNVNAVDTTVTIDPVVGTYTLRLTADDGEFSVFDELVVTVLTGGEILSIAQVNHVDTGFSNPNSPLPVPAIDPAGIVYHEPTDRLIITDSEINEVSAAFDIVQANVFATTLDVSATLDQWDFTQNTGAEPSSNREPTGIAYCAGDGHFYVSNDDTDYIYRYSYDGTSFTAVDAVSTRPLANDPEGVTCDPSTGEIYVIGGVDVSILVYSYDSGFVFERFIDLPSTAGDPNGFPNDSEGIAFDPGSGHLFVMAANDNTIYEYDTDGVFVQKFDIGGFSPTPTAAQGISVGRSSSNPEQTSFYIVDGGVDNNDNSNERDGHVYEAIITRATN